MKRSYFLSYALMAMLVTILAGLIYVSVQQSHRSAANDPQLQMAGDIRERLDHHQSIDPLMAMDSIDLAKSLATFTVLYDASGEPIRSNGVLDGQLPRLPKGVFEFTRKKEEDVLTWQPRLGIRMALVVEYVQSPGSGIAFVAVGRSLKEVEKRVGNLTTMVLAGWLACLGLILLHGMIMGFQKNNRKI